MTHQPLRLVPIPAWGVVVLTVVLGLVSSVLVPASGARATGTGAGTVRTLDGDPENRAVSRSITLITGDVVHWTALKEGPGSAIVEDRGVTSVFETVESDEGYYVIPSEVAPLVGTLLDRELFNVASLVEQGYTDDAVDGLPVIVQSKEGSNARSRGASTPPGLKVEQRLASIDSVAGTLAHGEAESFGRLLGKAARDVKPTATKGDTQGRSSSGSTPDITVDGLAGVERIWLDEKVKVSLEESVPQTGAPTMWAAGYTGTGMKVGVLDTGIDQNHPDVADKIVASKNFSSNDSVQDGHGHGTHVASIAAGTGAASDGLRKGVAPGASLVIGKVMDDSGSGANSDIIAGMEWAVGEGDADVINMSLGGGYTDGTDPMSLAVNELTEEHGVLFVVSAGNDGPRSSTLTAPATADAALTVGAVDKEHELAYFSSRGPRLGDFAIKPEITAPGVGIQAARASGTSMGSPVDDFYTSTSGTSMASPHVAGAVALLKQEHPDWTPAQLKSALVNSATPNSSDSVFEQGGGELDLAQAMKTSVVTTPSTLSMGNFEYPHDDATPVTKELTYTNLGEESVSVDLGTRLMDDEGKAAPAGMLTVAPSSLDLAPGSSAQVSVTLDRTLGGEGTFSGQLLATDADGNRISSTPAGFIKESEVYDITVEGIQRNGEPAAAGSQVAVLDATNFSDFRRSSTAFVDGVATIQVPPGTYSVMSMIRTEGEDGHAYSSQALMGDPEIEITADTHLTFDAREAVEVTPESSYEDAEVVSHAIQYRRTGEESGNLTQTWIGGDWPYYVSPTEPVTLGGFSFGTKFEVSSPEAYMTLAFPEDGAIPADTTYEVNSTNTATVKTAYHSDSPDQTYRRSVPSRFPWEGMALALFEPVPAPSERAEVFSANEVRFTQVVMASSSSGGRLSEPETGFEPGAELEQSWLASPRTPSPLEGNEYTASRLPTSRLGNTLNVHIFEFSDSNLGEGVHYGSLNPFDATEGAAFRLYQDGELYATGPRAFGTISVAQQSRLRFELDVHRENDLWTTSTQTRTVWEFDSATTESETPLPLLQVDYDADVDLTNTLVGPSKRSGPPIIGLHPRMPYGLDDPEIQQVKAWVSLDDGVTWTKRPVLSAKDGYAVVAGPLQGAGHVSLKVEVTDRKGNSVTQEVIRAYAL
ncbi:MAG: S8 family peptidase [Nocardioides sp.]|uniref:S8 family peptidase n=1 Tax=Nocardioides sp. TaxID=35761 RepID=UPI003D6ADF07